jgi:hypothetical protein
MRILGQPARAPVRAVAPFHRGLLTARRRTVWTAALRHKRFKLTHDVHLLAQAMATLLASTAARRSAAAQACRVPRLMPRVLVADVLALLREALSESERMACVAAHDASCVVYD